MLMILLQCILVLCKNIYIYMVEKALSVYQSIVFGSKQRLKEQTSPYIISNNTTMCSTTSVNYIITPDQHLSFNSMANLVIKRPMQG